MIKSPSIDKQKVLGTEFESLILCHYCTVTLQKWREQALPYELSNNGIAADADWIFSSLKYDAIRENQKHTCRNSGVTV